MEKQHLEYDDFYEILWGNISSKIVDENYLYKNEKFINSITFDFYRLYQMDDSLSMVVIRKMTESFFFNYFIFSPS